MESLARFAKRLNYTFTDITWLKLALTHRSVSQKKQNNERLEFLGDAIVNLVIAEALYQQFPLAREGELTRLRAQLVQKTTLSEVAKGLGIEDHLLMSPAEFRTGGMRKPSIQADALEAIIGAIHQDGGFEAAKACILHWFRNKLTDIDATIDKDPKTALQEHQQKFNQPLPKYEVVAIEGEAHQQKFTVRCIIRQLTNPTLGEGNSRQKAEFVAAHNALEQLKC